MTTNQTCLARSLSRRNCRRRRSNRGYRHYNQATDYATSAKLRPSPLQRSKNMPDVFVVNSLHKAATHGLTVVCHGYPLVLY